LQANTNEKNGSFLGLVRQWHIASFFRWRAGGCQTTSDATVSLGHDAEFLERQLIECVPYYPKPDIENAEIP